MNTTTARALVALMGGFVWVAGGAAASELRFSDIETRLSTIEQKLAQEQGVQLASYMAENGPVNGALVNGGAACHACDGWDYSGCCAQPCGHWYAELHLLWLRIHTYLYPNEFSERHYFAPRVVLGYEDCCGVGGRVRYFHWGNSVRDDSGEHTRFEWDVIDVEATGRLRWGRTDVLFAGGFRYANMFVDWIDADLFGLTFATDARTLLWCQCNSGLYAVYGARISILGGDWVYDDWRRADDNVLVRELYIGTEYRCSYCGYDLFVRATYEMQNWHSDFWAHESETDSIGLIGPGVHFGATF